MTMDSFLRTVELKRTVRSGQCSMRSRMNVHRLDIVHPGMFFIRNVKWTNNMSEQYTYAVARIRALEVSLFSDSTIDQLIACQSYDQALQFLEEKGWGDTESSGMRKKS